MEMPSHFKGKKGAARKKALAEHAASGGSSHSSHNNGKKQAIASVKREWTTQFRKQWAKSAPYLDRPDPNLPASAPEEAKATRAQAMETYKIKSTGLKARGRQYLVDHLRNPKIWQVLGQKYNISQQQVFEIGQETLEGISGFHDGTPMFPGATGEFDTSWMNAVNFSKEEITDFNKATSEVVGSIVKYDKAGQPLKDNQGRVQRFLQNQQDLNIVDEPIIETDYPEEVFGAEGRSDVRGEPSEFDVEREVGPRMEEKIGYTQGQPGAVQAITPVGYGKSQKEQLSGFKITQKVVVRKSILHPDVDKSLQPTQKIETSKVADFSSDYQAGVYKKGDRKSTMNLIPSSAASWEGAGAEANPKARERFQADIASQAGFADVGEEGFIDMDEIMQGEVQPGFREAEVLPEGVTAEHTNGGGESYENRIKAEQARASMETRMKEFFRIAEAETGARAKVALTIAEALERKLLITEVMDQTKEAARSFLRDPGLLTGNITGDIPYDTGEMSQSETSRKDALRKSIISYDTAAGGRTGQDFERIADPWREDWSARRKSEFKLEEEQRAAGIYEGKRKVSAAIKSKPQTLAGGAAEFPGYASSPFAQVIDFNLAYLDTVDPESATLVRKEISGLIPDKLLGTTGVATPQQKWSFRPPKKGIERTGVLDPVDRELSMRQDAARTKPMDLKAVSQQALVSREQSRKEATKKSKSTILSQPKEVRKPVEGFPTRYILASNIIKPRGEAVPAKLVKPPPPILVSPPKGDVPTSQQVLARMTEGAATKPRANVARKVHKFKVQEAHGIKVDSSGRPVLPDTPRKYKTKLQTTFGVTGKLLSFAGIALSPVLAASTLKAAGKDITPGSLLTQTAAELVAAPRVLAGVGQDPGWIRKMIRDPYTASPTRKKRSEGRPIPDAGGSGTPYAAALRWLKSFRQGGSESISTSPRLGQRKRR